MMKWRARPGCANRGLTRRSAISTATCTAVTGFAAAVVAMLGSLVLITATAAASNLPQPTSYNRLFSVSCASSASCWAVGASQDTNNNVTGETLRWDGSSWTSVASPALAGATLDGVTCISSGSCWAIGGVGNGQAFPRPLIARWNGSGWSSVSLPHLRQEVVEAISCSSSTSCMAVGSYKRGDRTLAVHWNGSRWSQVPTPNPSRKYGGALTTVACSSARSCWAFGYYYAAPLKPTLTGYLIALHWNGTAWKLAWTSKPYYGGESSASFGLDIGCASTSDCWTVGYSSLSPLDYHPIILHLKRGNWAPVQPPKFKNASLHGVSCSSARSCWAVGDTGTFYGGTHSLALHWNGTRWSKATTPPGHNDTLTSVACPSLGSCWAVGNDETSAGNTLNLADRWAGGSWMAY